jgi:hypothetical protein
MKNTLNLILITLICNTITSQSLSDFENSPYPDFTLRMEINYLDFKSNGEDKEFVMRISELKGYESTSQIVVILKKASGFKIKFNPAKNDLNNNNNWEITENNMWIVMRLKDSVKIEPHGFSNIRFTINRNLNIPNRTLQSVTATILENSGGDSEKLNNTTSLMAETKY